MSKSQQPKDLQDQVLFTVDAGISGKKKDPEIIRALQFGGGGGN